MKRIIINIKNKIKQFSCKHKEYDSIPHDFEGIAPIYFCVCKNCCKHFFSLKKN